MDNISSDPTMGEIIQSQLDSRLQQLPFPIRCKITKVYDDNKHVDIDSDFGEQTYIECIANNPTVNNIGILVFLNGTNEDMIVITK